MQPELQTWMPAILALFGSLIVVVVTAWMNTKALSAQIDALRSEMAALRAEFRKEMAEFRLEMHKESSELRRRIDRLEDELRPGLFRP